MASLRGLANDGIWSFLRPEPELDSRFGVHDEEEEEEEEVISVACQVRRIEPLPLRSARPLAAEESQALPSGAQGPSVVPWPPLLQSQTRFIEEPEDQTVVAGQRMVLSCVVLNYSGIVQWTKDGLALGMGQGLKELSSDPQGADLASEKGKAMQLYSEEGALCNAASFATLAWRLRVIGSADSGHYDLEITAAELSDDALYECQATEAALRSRRAKLTVLIPPEDPLIDGAPEILLRAGTPYNLTCRARSAKPAATIVWLRDGVQQGEAAATVEVLSDGKRETTVSQLLINPTDQDIGRVYVCRCANEAVPAGKETSIKLNVHHPPTVTLSIQPQTVQEGERVTFTCLATANPEIKGYRWAKGGLIIEEAKDSRYETQVDYTFFTEPVSCEVHNDVGSTNVSTLVDVHFAPRIVVDPKPTTTDIGSDVTLTCVWAGNPPLTLTWTKKESNMVLSNSNQLFLKSVTQADAGQYVCKAIVPRIGVGEREVTLFVNGPPIISSESVQYAVRGDRGKVECFIGSTPLPDRIAWGWKENVLETGTLERYTVERSNTGAGVLSTLSIHNVMEVDFQTRYNCTAWNSFGPRTAIIQLEEKGRKDVTLRKLDIKVETVNREPLTLHADREEDTASVSTATRVMKAIYSSFKDDVDLKQDLRCDTIDPREEYELKDPTNGYYNVRAHEDRPNSRSTMLYADYRNPGPARFEARPSSRLSHSSGYAQLSTYGRGPASDYSGDPGPGPTPGTASAETASQLSYENYGGHTAFPASAGYASYRLGYTQPPPPALDRAAFDPLGKYTAATRFSYTSSDYGQRFQQRMQTHV
ncbi:hypothetical protein lerEdw1_011528 [Lerista edwardsae]|nr:hypothetical protein lerEdw1_011528 [Lerista edwardsae]